MVIGTAVVALCLLVLGFTREIVGIFEADDNRARKPTIVLAVLAIYAVDFAINAGMPWIHLRSLADLARLAGWEGRRTDG